MQRTYRTILATLVVFAATGSIIAQATWLVGGSSGLPQIRDALQLASP